MINREDLEHFSLALDRLVQSFLFDTSALLSVVFDSILFGSSNFRRSNTMVLLLVQKCQWPRPTKATLAWC